MSNFTNYEEGDLVVCIDAAGVRDILQEGTLYLVSDVCFPYIWVVSPGTLSPLFAGITGGFRSDRFELFETP